jgi:hypothetical protein
VLLIGVGLTPATTQLMQGLCSSKVCTYIPCGSDYNMVKAAVAKAGRFKVHVVHHLCCIVMLMKVVLQLQSLYYASMRHSVHDACVLHMQYVRH